MNWPEMNDKIESLNTRKPHWMYGFTCKLIQSEFILVIAIDDFISHNIIRFFGICIGCFHERRCGEIA